MEVTAWVRANAAWAMALTAAEEELLMGAVAGTAHTTAVGAEVVLSAGVGAAEAGAAEEKESCCCFSTVSARVGRACGSLAEVRRLPPPVPLANEPIAWTHTSSAPTAGGSSTAMGR